VRLTAAAEATMRNLSARAHAVAYLESYKRSNWPVAGSAL